MISYRDNPYLKIDYLKENSYKNFFIIFSLFNKVKAKHAIIDKTGGNF